MYAGMLNNYNPSVHASQAYSGNTEIPTKKKRESSALSQLGAGTYDLGAGLAYAAEDAAVATGFDDVAKYFGTTADELKKKADASGDPEGFWQNVAREVPETLVSFVPYVGKPVAAASAYGNSLEGQREEGGEASRGQAALSGALNLGLNLARNPIAKKQSEKAMGQLKRFKAYRQGAINSGVEPTTIVNSKSFDKAIDAATKATGAYTGTYTGTTIADNVQKELLSKPKKKKEKPDVSE